MISNAGKNFELHIVESSDAISIHEYLVKNSGYRADFSLRFVWIAAVSSLDHYLTQLIVERACEDFAEGRQLQPKLLNELMPVSRALELQSADVIKRLLVFRDMIDHSVRYRSFQSPENISDGLSYIWGEKHKWQKISQKLGVDTATIKSRLSAIVDRRNLIAHNADFDVSTNSRFAVESIDAKEVVSFISNLVGAIDEIARNA